MSQLYYIWPVQPPRSPAVRRILARYIHSPQLVLGFFPERFARPEPDWPAKTHLTGFVVALEAVGALIIRPLATYPAYLCPLHCGGALSHSRLRTTILHSECGDCKRFFEYLTTNLGSPAQTAFEGSLW